jgi:hypothetical protein
VVIGWPVETVGILLVAAPDLAPWVAAARRRARRALGRPAHHHVAIGTATSQSSAHGVGVVSVAADASDERKLQHLMRTTNELQGRVGSVENAMSGLPAQWRADIQDTENSVRRDLADRFAVFRSEYRRERRLGTALLIVGGLLLAGANLVS